MKMIWIPQCPTEKDFERAKRKTELKRAEFERKMARIRQELEREGK